GSQPATLARLAAFRPEILKLRELGAAILVPLQTGHMNMVEFYKSTVATLGFRPVPAVPMKKAPQSHQHIIDFIVQSSVPDIHFLGIGTRNPQAQALIAKLLRAKPSLR